MEEDIFFVLTTFPKVLNFRKGLFLELPLTLADIIRTSSLKLQIYLDELRWTDCK